MDSKKAINEYKKLLNDNSKYTLTGQIKTGLVIECCDKIRPLNEISYSFPVYLLGI